MTGKHRKPPTRKLGKLAAVGALFATPLLTTGSATAQDWSELAQCESSGDWQINTGNGFYGGLQFTSSTWAAFGGEQYAPEAHLASKAQQIAIAEKVLAVQGPGAWPSCSASTSWESGSGDTPQPTNVTDESYSSSQASTQVSTEAEVSAGGQVTVQSGDTLSGIAAEAGASLDAVISLNADAISDPALIYPGEVIELPA